MKLHITTPGIYELTKVGEITPTQPPIATPEPTQYEQVGRTYSAWEFDGEHTAINPDRTIKLMDAFNTGEFPFEAWQFGNQFYKMVADRVNEQTYLYVSSSPTELGTRYDCTLRFRGQPIPFLAQNIVVLPDGTAWLLAEYNGEVWVCGQHGSKTGQFTEFSLAKKVKINGAKDTKHALHYDSVREKWFIHGRKRGIQDYANETNPYKLNRRSVRILQADTPDGSWDEVGSIDPLDYQPNYRATRFRQDYYSSDIANLNGFLVTNIGTYFQDEQWKIPHRPERISGTGETYPVFAISSDGLTWKFRKCLLDLDLHRSETGNVGQIHAGSMVIFNGKLYLYYFVRHDIHYFERGGQPKSEHFVAVWDNVNKLMEMKGKAVPLDAPEHDKIVYYHGNNEVDSNNAWTHFKFMRKV